MKKIMMLMLSALLVFTSHATVFAEDAITVKSADASEIVLSYESEAGVAEGLLTVTYDEALISIDVDAIEYAEGIVLHAANAEAGVLKVAFIGEGDVDAGNLITFPVEVKDADAEITIEYGMESYDLTDAIVTSGEDVKTVVIQEGTVEEPSTEDGTVEEPSTEDGTVEEPSTEDGTTEEPSTEETTGGDSLFTGDTTSGVMGLVVVAMAAVVMAFVAFKMKKGGAVK